MTPPVIPRAEAERIIAELNRLDAVVKSHSPASDLREYHFAVYSAAVCDNSETLLSLAAEALEGRGKVEILEIERDGAQAISNAWQDRARRAESALTRLRTELGEARKMPECVNKLVNVAKYISEKLPEPFEALCHYIDDAVDPVETFYAPSAGKEPK